MKFKITWNDQRDTRGIERGWITHRIDCIKDNKIIGFLRVQEINKKVLNFPQFLCYVKNIKHPLHNCLTSVKKPFVFLKENEIYYYEGLNINLKELEEEHKDYLSSHEKVCVSYVHVEEKFRRKGIATKLYKKLSEVFEQSIYSDTSQTDSVKKVWDNLVSSGFAKKEGDRYVI